MNFTLPLLNPALSKLLNPALTQTCPYSTLPLVSYSTLPLLKPALTQPRPYLTMVLLNPLPEQALSDKNCAMLNVNVF